MKKTAVKITAALTAAVMAVSSAPAYTFAASKTAAVFDSASYCEIDGSYADGKVTIKWAAVSGAESYKIYRETGSGIFSLAGTVKKCSFNDKKVSKGKLYRYKVYAVCGNKKSVPSEILHVGIPEKGNAVIYTFDIPVDYESRRDFPLDSFDTYDKNTYGKKSSKTKPPYYIVNGEDAMDSAKGEGYSDAAAGAPADYEDDYDCADEPDASYDGYDRDDKRGNRGVQYIYRGEDKITAGTLTAGKHDDNASYSKFKKLLDSEEWQEYVDDRGFYLDERYTVRVTDEKGKPVENVPAELRDAAGNVLFAARTNNKGIAYIFTGFADVRKAKNIVVPLPDGGEAVQPFKTAGSVTNVTYKGGRSAEKQLDIMLTIDSTGSMSDEIKYLEAEFRDVVERVSKDNGNIRIRTSVNFYRDEGDEYLYRSYNFRTKTDTVTKSIGHERATGGGDFPEAVHTALDISINKHKWNADSTKIMFLVLDAPPHYNDKINEEFIERVAEASAAGIRIIPIVSSGSDEDTEYLMRSAAAATGGKYIFLTDDSGVGDSHAEPAIEQYEIAKLNDLMVKVIDEYLK